MSNCLEGFFLGLVEPLYKTIDLDKLIFERKIVNIFLPISFNIYFGCSKEPSHGDSYFEYPQHMFWLRNKKVVFWYELLTKGLKTL